MGSFGVDMVKRGEISLAECLQAEESICLLHFGTKFLH